MRKGIHEGISIVVCCYNSSERIRETLQHLALQELSTVPYEILLIDNASTDNTAEYSFKVWEELHSPYPLRIIHEPNAGLSFARKTGIKESQYNLILFCDDDNHLASDYLINSYKLMSEMDQVGIIGGISLPKLEYYPGNWIVDMYGALAISNSHSKKEGNSEWVFGGGMVIRKRIYQEFDERNIQLQLTDRLGSKQTSGGDTEICFYARYLGYKIWTSKNLEFHHCINKKRLNKSFFIKGNYRNIYPSIYLYILEILLFKKAVNKYKLYLKFFFLKIKGVVYFFPRMILGKHRFYSFLMFYQNTQILVGLIFRIKYFFRYYNIIKRMINE